MQIFLSGVSQVGLFWAEHHARRCGSQVC